jgi:hypothetical protein
MYVVVVAVAVLCSCAAAKQVTISNVTPRYTAEGIIMPAQ